jgi:hypothetical protein
MDTMSVSKQIKERISQIEAGAIFGVKEFEQIGRPQVVALELSRLSKKGTIERLTKGKYFIPKSSKFGKLQPSEWEIINQLMKESGGYLAGASALNRIGVTTQVPSQITIRGARSTRILKIGSLSVSLFKQGNAEANDLQPTYTDTLEALRLIKKTPDGSYEKTINRISAIVKSQTKEFKSALAKLSLSERPYVRALLGAILENMGSDEAQRIRASLNPLSSYKIGISVKLLPNKKAWRII